MSAADQNGSMNAGSDAFSAAGIAEVHGSAGSALDRIAAAARGALSEVPLEVEAPVKEVPRPRSAA
jgi:hypothetical protein